MTAPLKLKDAARLTPDMLTPAEVAATLRVSVRSVTRLCVKNELPAYKIGGSWRIDRVAFLRWMRKRRGTAWRIFTDVAACGGSASNGGAKKSGARLEQLLKARPEAISQTCKRNTAS